MRDFQSALKHLWGSFRQILQPAEFRIDEPVFPPEWIETLERLAREPMRLEPPPIDEPTLRQLLAAVGTGVWRLRQRMVESGTAVPKEQFRREFRDLEALWDVLAQVGVRIQDHTGERIAAGHAIEVLQRQPTEGATEVRVSETIKPSIYYN